MIASDERGDGFGATGLRVWLALLAAVAAFGLARTTLLPGLGFWDTGEFQTVGPLLGTAHPTGFPAYVLLGWLGSVVLTTFGDPAFRMNLLSAVLVAVSAGLLVVLVHQLTGHVWIAFGTGLVAGTTPVIWDIGTHADAHALHLVLVALLFVLLVGWEQRSHHVYPGDWARSGATGLGAPGAGRRGDRWLVAATVVYGVALANHTLALLLAPGIGLFVLAVQPGILGRGRFVGHLVVTLIVTVAALYLELPLRAGPFRAPLVYGRPETLDGFLYVALGEQFVGGLDPFGNVGGKLADLIALGQAQLGLLVLLVPAGLVVAIVQRPRYALLSGVTFAVTAWFAASYENAAIERYYLGPALIALTWVAMFAAWIAGLLWRQMGLAGGLDRPRGVMASPGRGALLGTPSAGALGLEVAVAALLLVPAVAALPAREAAVDQSTVTEASDWAHLAMRTFAPDAVVVSWWSYSTTLWYVQLVEGVRPDVWIVDDRTRLDQNLGDVSDVIDAQLGRRPVYLVRLPESGEIDDLRSRYDFEETEMPTGQPIDRVLGRRNP